MSIEYFNSLNSICSNSFDSCKHREKLNGEIINTECDNESLMEYNAETSTKASSSSIQESIANMSNSHSTSEDNFSENAISSPFPKQFKPDIDKDFDILNYQYLKNNNGILKIPVCSNNNNINYKSIDDTIESVLSKIREENDSGLIKTRISTSSDISADTSNKSEAGKISNSLMMNGLQNLGNLKYSKDSFPLVSYDNSNTQAARNDSRNFHNNYSNSNFNKNHHQSFYNYGNYYSISNPNNFASQINLPNYNGISYCKDSDKTDLYLSQNQPYKPYMMNSYLNQQYFRPELQPDYQLFQKQFKRNSGYDYIIHENEINSQQYGINFKTPQLSPSVYFDPNVRKKRCFIDQNKVNPIKKRKLINQLPMSNSCEDIIGKLKNLDHNSLLISPSISLTKTLLPPLEFIEYKTDSTINKNPIKYQKYKSSPYFIRKPKRFKNNDQSDNFLSNYVSKTAFDNTGLLSNDCNAEVDYLSDIVCMSPCDGEQSPKNLLSHLDTMDSNLRITSPELFSSSSHIDITDTSWVNQQYYDCPIPFNHLTSSVIAYSDNDTKLVTQPPQLAQRDSRTYSQMSGSFLKRTKVNGKSFSDVHIEEAVSVASLGASREQNCCRQCLMFITPLSWIKINGRKLGGDPGEDYLFCSIDCCSKFKCNISSDCTANKILLSTNKNEVVIKMTPHKPPGKNCKKSCDFEQYVRRRFPSEGQSEASVKTTTKLSASAINNRLLGVNYSYFKSGEEPCPLYKEIDLDDQTYLLAKYICSFRSCDVASDTRICVLCRSVGDDNESVCGRLINIDCETWVHLNCGLWCFEVFETVSGSLVGVQSAVEKALKTTCALCGSSGAGLQCYRNKCGLVYHVPCASKANCVFYTDRGMYCPSHAVLNHPMHLQSLKVHRRVNVHRDESALVTDVVMENSREARCALRTGTLVLHSVGQLLPEQLTSGNFNSSSIIYPIGYHSTRIYWSSLVVNRRCKYECYIDEDEENKRPLFRVVSRDADHEVVFCDHSCDGLWKKILNKIAALRKEGGLTRLFPRCLSGEQLYGLTEPHIVRVVESLPGVEMLSNYAFKFGKLQLITEMPLAVNPTGCARTEPQLRTHVRRYQIDSLNKINNQCGILKAKIGQQFGFNNEIISKASINNNSRTNQYKTLKNDWFNNVTLSRSKIQGLGLFAAKDFDKATMIIEYIGETIRNEVANRREQLYQSRSSGIYMFRLSDDLIIDATVNGGLARYINHSCNPNCVAEFLPLDCGGRIIISTKQPIVKGEELTYDYKFDFEDNKSNLIPCLCGASNCRRWMN